SGAGPSRSIRSLATTAICSRPAASSRFPPIPRKTAPRSRMADLQKLHREPRSAVLQAGAGTGKTHSLVTLCLHALAGVVRPEPLPPARLWAVTFSDKAAAELKGRIRQRVDRLAASTPG